MERNKSTILPIQTPDGVDYAEHLGKAVSITGTLGGDYGVIVEAYPGNISVALFGGNAGIMEVKLSGTVAAGDFLKCEANGTFTVATSTSAAARAIEAGVTNERIGAVLLPPSAATTHPESE